MEPRPGRGSHLGHSRPGLIPPDIKFHGPSTPGPVPPTPANPCHGGETQKAVIARAVWNETHWPMPRDRNVTVTVDSYDIGVELGGQNSVTASATP